MFQRAIAITAALLAVTSIPARAQIVGASESSALRAFDGTAGDQYGQGLALDGNTLAVGAWFDDASNDQGGSVYVYVGAGSSWTLQQKIDPALPTSQYRFGENLALQGDRLVVGCSWDGQGAYQSGAVYVYERVGGVWSQVVKLKGSGVSYNRNLGRSIALDGDTIAAGAVYGCCATSPAGGVHVFRRVAGTWTEEGVLTGIGTGASDAFGQSVALEGDRLVVGQSGLPWASGNRRGSVHVFQRTGATWSQTQRIDAPGAAQVQHFGHAVALRGATLVVGAPNAPSADGSQADSGSVEVYAESAGTWVHAQSLQPNDSSDGDRIGQALALEGDLLLVGAPSREYAAGIGGAYVYERVAGAWTQRAKLVASTDVRDDDFGAALPLDGTTAFVGAPAADGLSTDAGAVFEYALPANPIGATFCAGDGSAGPCPCSNASGVGAQLGCKNLYGRGAWLVAAGSASASADDLAFVAHGVTNAPGVLYASTTTSPAIPFGNGLTCLASPIALQSRPSIRGSAYFGPGLGAIAAWSAGQTWSFQMLHRDGAASPCTTRRNATSAVQVVIAP